jgi:hypothetical protein
MRHFVRLALICVLTAAAARAAADTVWFEVGASDPAFPESFLLPLSDPGHIAQARARLAGGAGSGVGSIAVALIRAGGDGLNRNRRAARQPLWSWHVSEFLGFADSAIEICDGWPGFIEQDPEAFIANTNGTICLWGYSVTGELALPPTMAVSEALDGFWYDPASSGQGFALDVLADKNMVTAGWFTYHNASPQQGQSNQRWLIGAGSIAGDGALLTVTESSGGRLNQSAPVTTRIVGDLRLRFIDCNHAQAVFAIDAQPEQNIRLQRTVPRYDCGAR